MSFTYDLTLAPDISQIRLELGDTSPMDGDGVQPNGKPFEDEELAYFLSKEGGSVMRATAAACEALSRAWSKMASINVGGRSEQFGVIAKEWATRAATLRDQYGSGSDTSSTLTAGVLDLNFAETGSAGDEYA